MKKIALLVFLSALLVACGKTYNQKQILTPEQEDSIWEAEKAEKVRLEKVAINDSLNKIGNKFFADLYWYMPQEIYNKTIDSIKSEIGGCVKVEDFFFRSFTPTFEDDKLVVFSLSSDSYGYSGSDESRNPKYRVLNYLKEKYGEHDSGLNAFENDHKVRWIYDSRIIEYSSSVDQISFKNGTPNTIYNTLTITYMAPKYYKKITAEADSIKQIEKQRLQEQALKREKFDNSI